MSRDALAGACQRVRSSQQFISTIEPIQLPSGRFDRVPVDDLSAADTHVLTLVRRNEAWQGIVRLIASETAEGGVLIPSPPLPDRRILCIGDPITDGEYADLIPPVKKSHAEHNAEAAFGWQLARNSIPRFIWYCMEGKA